MSDDGGMQYWQQLGMQEHFEKIFNDVKGKSNDSGKYEVLGISQENRPEKSKTNNWQTIQGQ